MRLVTKDLKCLESGSGKSDDLHRTTISHFCSYISYISFLLPVAFHPLRPHRKSETCYPSPSPSQLRIPQLLIEIPCPAKTTLREIGKMNLVMRRKCDMEAGE